MHKASYLCANISESILLPLTPIALLCDGELDK